jgi:hypothetical protein
MHVARKLYSIKTKPFQNVFGFDGRNKSCFCSFCIEVTESTYICEKEIEKYVKTWRHTKINTKGKMTLASLEEIESNETIVSIVCNGVFDLVREGNLCFDCSNIFFMLKQSRFTCIRNI